MEQTKQSSLFIVHVHAHVLPECIDQFKGAPIENARQSLTEPVNRTEPKESQDEV